MKENQELFDFDKDISNGKIIIGVDEAGRGPLAGNVVATASYILNYNQDMFEINDSKKLTEKKREKLYNIISDNCIVGVGIATVDEIDEINILNATFLSMNRAIADILEKLKARNIIKSEEDFIILVDGNHKIKNCNYSQISVVKGDAKSLSIASASIVAKVTRDRQLIELDRIYPEYMFAKHKGYGTKKHVEVILEKGYIDGVHRKTFLKKNIMSKIENRKKGTEYEKKTIDFLKSKGYEILETNYRVPRAEIDIIAKIGNTIVFVEVKYRKNNLYGYGMEAVNKNKINKIVMAANSYMQSKQYTHYGMRIDCISFLSEELTWIKNITWGDFNEF